MNNPVSIPGKPALPGTLHSHLLKIQSEVAKELQLRASTKELMEENVLAAALTNSLREANTQIDTGKDINLRLDLEQVLGGRKTTRRLDCIARSI